LIIFKPKTFLVANFSFQFLEIYHRVADTFLRVQRQKPCIFGGKMTEKSSF
jgi:hypothetical protein